MPVYRFKVPRKRSWLEMRRIPRGHEWHPMVPRGELEWLKSRVRYSLEIQEREWQDALHEKLGKGRRLWRKGNQVTTQDKGLARLHKLLELVQGRGRKNLVEQFMIEGCSGSCPQYKETKCFAENFENDLMN